MNVRDYTDIRLPTEPKTYPCSRCKGTGELEHDECRGQGVFFVDGFLVQCSCNDGRIQCFSCDGSGREEE